MKDPRYPHLSDDLLELVDWFAEQMKAQLEENCFKGDAWKEDDTDQFAIRTREEAYELIDAAILLETHIDNRRYAREVVEEAADVANMAMFTASAAKKTLD